MGISSEISKLSDRDNDIITRFEDDLKFKDGRYESKLIWKSNPDEIDNNFKVAKSRLEALRNRLNKDLVIYQEYKEIIEDQFEKGIVGECSTEVQNSEYFMAHRSIYRSDKVTSRVRIVFDSSSK